MTASYTQSNNTRPPRVVMEEMVYHKIMHWVMKSQYEVSGLGKVVMEGGDIRIVEAILLPQKNTSTTTDIEGADFGKAAWLLKDTPGELQFWWHSHVNMPVFWSNTDLQTMWELGKGGHFVHTVFNKRKETRTAITQSIPFPMIMDDIPLHVERTIDPDLIASWDKEYDDKVTNVVPKQVPATVSRYPQHHSSSSPVFTKEERAELARLAKLMSDDEDGENEFGIGPDGVYGDLDSPLVSQREHEKQVTIDVSKLLDRRDKLENSIEAIEDRMEVLENARAQIPKGMQKALDKYNAELSEIEDELDQLVRAGILDEAVRYCEPNHKRGDS